jgi:histidinol-phosphate aminotransferase
MFKARAAVEKLGAYHPPLANRTGLHLDFNENTSGCAPAVLAALRGLTGAEIATYPERETGERLVAQNLGLEAGQILLTNGTDEGLHLIAGTYLEPGDEVVICVPTFAMYEIYARSAGANVVSIPAGRDFGFPTEKVIAALTHKTKLIVVANPNNPTGTVVANSDLVRLAQAAPAAGLVVDEAYYDFCGQTILPGLNDLPNLIVTRTFSKAYGMAGLRLGVIIAHPAQVDMLRKVSSPYNVNAAALACLPIALADQSYVQTYVAEVTSGRAGLEALLDEFAIEYWPSKANFVLVRFGAMRLALLRAMRERGILVRDRHSDPGCDGCVRITLGTTGQNVQLLSTLREVLSDFATAALAKPGVIS